MNSLAIFDVDWTIIKPKNGRTFPANRYDWQWLNENVKSFNYGCITKCTGSFRLFKKC